jgi:hypothetical protein
MGKTFVQRSLNQTQFSWDQIVARHPEMAEHEDAVHTLAHGDDDMDHSAHDLVYRYKDVDPKTVRAHLLDYGRYKQAQEGYKSGAAMPPPLLVRRGSWTSPADGNHRILGARHVVDTVRAVVASKK